MKTRKREPLEMGVDMTPMIDCVFLLLIFFMCASTMSRVDFTPEVSLPVAPKAAVPEDLRGKFALPEDKVSVLLVDGAGTVLHVEPDAQDKLERVLTGINEMIRSLSLTSDPNLPAGPAPSAAPAPSRRSR